MGGNYPNFLKRRNAEKGEGTAKLVLTFGVFIYVAIVAIMNIPIYFDVVGLKHDLDEVARVAGENDQPIGKIQQQIDDNVIKNHDIKPSEIHPTKDGKTVSITVDTHKMINLLIYKYDWHVTHESKGRWQ